MFENAADFTVSPEFFKDTYGFGPGLGGLTYLGLGFGFLGSTFAGAKFLDKLYVKVCVRRGIRAAIALD